MRDQTDTKSAAVLRCPMESTGSPKNLQIKQPISHCSWKKRSKSSGSQPASVLPSRSCTKSILYQVVIVCLCIYIYNNNNTNNNNNIDIPTIPPSQTKIVIQNERCRDVSATPGSAGSCPGSEAAEPWHGAMDPIGQVILRHLRPHELMQAMAIFWAPRGRSKSTYGRCWSLNRGGIVFVSFGAGPIHQLS